MELGLLRTVGLGALSLWPLVLLQQRLVLVARECVSGLSSGMGTRLGLVFRVRRTALLLRLWIWLHRLAAHRSLRSVLPLVGRWLPRRIWLPSRLWVQQHQCDEHNEHYEFQEHQQRQLHAGPGPWQSAIRLQSRGRRLQRARAAGAEFDVFRAVRKRPGAAPSGRNRSGGISEGTDGSGNTARSSDAGESAGGESFGESRFNSDAIFEQSTLLLESSAACRATVVHPARGRDPEHDQAGSGDNPRKSVV